MEAVVGAAIRGGIAGCTCSPRESSTSSASGKQNLVSSGATFYLSSRRGSLRAVRQSPFSSTSLQDQSHVQYYRDVQHRVRKDRFADRVVRKAVAGCNEVVFEERVRIKATNKAKKVEKKMLKKLKKAEKVCARLSSSSSSSSSSESDTGETSKAGARYKRVDVDELKRDWTTISQSPLLNSIPTISSSFVIEQPPAAQQLASPVGNSRVAEQVEVVSSADLMAMQISSGVGIRRSGVSSSAHVHQTSMAGATVRSPSAETALLEVCLGGKCKKAGAEDVLSAFQANGVNASACNKCMKKCKLAINVRVHHGDDVPQMHSGIGVQDVTALSWKHFGAGTASREAIHV